jgi:asparagine synthase (glutamine-hydrolysing)
MCGFAGEFLFGPGRADRGLAVAMAERLTHRGPDEAGAFISTDQRCAIGFRRLRVIDPPGSAQPMSSSDGMTTIAFNGEIYNFPALRDQLSQMGAKFRTHGDTEVLLWLYNRHGRDMVRFAEGMFAFALYDEAPGRLLLGRDPLGQKPLWYAPLPDRIVFASEAKAILAHPKVKAEASTEAITPYVTMGCGSIGGESLFRGIFKLPPANTLVADDCLGRCECYWQPEACEIGLDVKQQIRERLEYSVASHMLSDVPLGALLSGGIDSAVIVALMSKAAGRAGGVKTFTAGFDDPKYDERSRAKTVAEHCRTEHTELLVDPDPKGMLDWVVDQYDEPFADSSALPTHFVCRAARRHVTVALTGDGGDEVFGGYDRYRAMYLGETMGPAKYLAVKVAAAVAGLFASRHERSRARRLIRFADGLSCPPAVQYFRYRRLFGPNDLLRLFSDDFLAGIDVNDPAERFCDLYEQAAETLPDEVARSQRHDMLLYLPGDLLAKTDIASMATSLELRAPMLDHRLVQMGLSLPVEMKLNRRRGKLILQEIFGDLLPPEVFTGPKRGFGVPLGRWLREELRQEMVDTLTDPALREMGIFKQSALAGLMNDHISGRADHPHRLWALMVLARWLVRMRTK